MDLSDYQIESDTALATTLPSRWYTDPGFLAEERRKIFHRSWQYVGSTSWLTKAGDHFSAEIQGEPLIVSRDKVGTLRALSNVCRHRAGPLVDGIGCSAALQCKYHGWTYDLDGRLRGAPEFEGVKNWDRASVRQPEFRLETWGPLIFVSLDDNAGPLLETLGAIPQETSEMRIDPNAYRFVFRRDYLVRCNWKVYVDNYQEGYHLPIAHPSLFKEIDYNRYTVENHNFHSRARAPVRAPQGSAPRQYGDAVGGEALYYWVFPNLMINVYPDNMSTNLVVPIDEETTLVVFEWFVPPGSTVGQNLPAPKYWPISRPLIDSESAIAADLQKVIGFSHQVQLEDIFLCESVQRALGSRTYDKGRLSVKRENGVHHFHRLVYNALSAN